MPEMLEIDCLKCKRTNRLGPSLVWMGLLVFSLALPACVLSPGSVAKQGMAQSECVDCHTDAERLVTLAVKIGKVRPKPGPSPESTGEC